MFVLDTNVLSELRKKSNADRNVVAWASSIAEADLFISATILMELRIGALRAAAKTLPQAPLLISWIEKIVLPRFDGRILAFDRNAALRCVELQVPRSRPERDTFIAATALVHDMTSSRATQRISKQPA